MQQQNISNKTSRVTADLLILSKDGAKSFHKSKARLDKFNEDQSAAVIMHTCTTHLATEGPVLKIVGGKGNYSSKYHMFLSHLTSLLCTALWLHMEMATGLEGSLVWQNMAIRVQDPYSANVYKLTWVWFNSVCTPWIQCVFLNGGYRHFSAYIKYLICVVGHTRNTSPTVG